MDDPKRVTARKADLMKRPKGNEDSPCSSPTATSETGTPRKVTKLMPSGKMKMPNRQRSQKKWMKIPVREGDFVWAKMTGYPSWPGKVLTKETEGDQKKARLLVFFFGTRNHAWIPEDKVYSYSEYKDVFLSKIQREEKQRKGSKSSSVTLKKLQAAMAEADLKLARRASGISESSDEDSEDSSSSEESPSSAEDFVNRRDAELAAERSRFQELRFAFSAPEIETPIEPPVKRTWEWFSRELKFEDNENYVEPELITFGIFGNGHHCVQLVKKMMMADKTNKMVVWRGLLSELREFHVKSYNLHYEEDPALLTRQADLIISCFAHEDALKKSNVLTEEGILKEINSVTYLEMTPVGFHTAKENERAVTAQGGIYRHAPTFSPCIRTDGKVPVLASGEETKDFFSSNYRHVNDFIYPILLEGDSFTAVKANSIYHMILSTVMFSLAESLWFADVLKLDQKRLIEVIYMVTGDEFISEKAKSMLSASRAVEDSFNLTHSCTCSAIKLACMAAAPQRVSLLASELLKCAAVTKRENEDIDLSEIYARRFDIASLFRRNRAAVKAPRFPMRPKILDLLASPGDSENEMEHSDPSDYEDNVLIHRDAGNGDNVSV